MRKTTQFALVGLALVAAANAAPLQGVFRFGGAAVVSQTYTDFVPSGPNGLYPALTADEGFIEFKSALNTGDFAFLNTLPNYEGDVEDRDALAIKTGEAINVPDFIEIYGAPRYRFTLQYVFPGTFSSADCFAAPADEQNCTPPNQVINGETFVSAFNLTNQEVGAGSGNFYTQASFRTRGIVEYLDPTLTTVIGVSRFEADFTADVQDKPFQEILLALQQGGSQDVGFTATVTVTPIPEPSTFALAGLALLGLARFGRSFRK